MICPFRSLTDIIVERMERCGNPLLGGNADTGHIQNGTFVYVESASDSSAYDMSSQRQAGVSNYVVRVHPTKLTCTGDCRALQATTSSNTYSVAASNYRRLVVRLCQWRLRTHIYQHVLWHRELFGAWRVSRVRQHCRRCDNR